MYHWLCWEVSLEFFDAEENFKTWLFSGKICSIHIPASVHAYTMLHYNLSNFKPVFVYICTVTH